MDSPETTALRNLLTRYLTGEETLENVVPQYASLLGRYFEAHLAALESGTASLSDFLPTLVIPEQRRRMQMLHDALWDSLPPSSVQYLSPDDPRDGAA